MDTLVMEAAHVFLYTCTGIAMMMILGGLPRPWTKKR